MQQLEHEVWKVGFLLLVHAGLLCFGLEVKMVLDNKDVCGDSASNRDDKIYWTSEKTAILVIGRSSDGAVFHDCSVIVGAATQESKMLRLSFDAFHVEDCRVALSINQSSLSDFRADNSPMARIGCKHSNIKLLHSKLKHFVKIHVHKSDKYAQGYNFRINITVTEKGRQRSNADPFRPVAEMMRLGAVNDSFKSHIDHKVGESNLEVLLNQTQADSLPESGPATHVVVIVGIVSLFVVGVALWLLVKYLLRRTQRWNEQCAERNMERAIHLYNNQEPPPESDYMYTAVPGREVMSVPVSSTRRNGHGHTNKRGTGGSRRGRSRSGEIAFVHGDGHIETFRLRDSEQERHRRDLNPVQPAAPRRVGAMPATTAGNRIAETVGRVGAVPATAAGNRSAEIVGDVRIEEEGEILGECPPSYEEALEMPTPNEAHLPLYVNLNDKKDDNHAT
ncbi:uncharacterized protein [Littorina saxatilis]|uniref:uncharacterized protein isoform X3 n=1 Tax=Littorina saxatilis TaxID=31220 RepID=UPI0038B53109